MVQRKAVYIGLIFFWIISFALYSQEYRTIYIKGVELGQTGKFEEAKEEIQRALKINPLYIPAKRAVDLLEDIDKGLVKKITAQHLFNGMVYFVNQQWEKARVEYKKALKTAPNYYYTCHNYASTFANLKEADLAIVYLKRAIFLKSAYPYSHYNLGIAYDYKQRYEKAIASYQRAIKLAPWYYKAYYNLGVVLYNMGKKEEAAQWSAKAVRIYPDYDLAFNSLMESFTENLSLIEKLIPVYREVIRKEPSKLFAYKKLGIIYWKSGRWKEAQELREQFEKYCAEVKNEKK